ncbi:hypothetical protein GCM10020229_10350 [Kitasatospora albolonga]
MAVRIPPAATAWLSRLLTTHEFLLDGIPDGGLLARERNDAATPHAQIQPNTPETAPCPATPHPNPRHRQQTGTRRDQERHWRQRANPPSMTR